MPADLDPKYHWMREQRRDVEPTQLLVIASQPRSGSSVLCEALAASGLGGRPQEHLSPRTLHTARSEMGLPRPSIAGVPKQIARRMLGRQPHWLGRVTRASLREYLDEMVHRTVTDNGVVATKMHHDHLAYLTRHRLRPESMGLVTRWVRLDRRDRFAQAVSDVRAVQTGRWNSTEAGSGAEPVYDLDQLRRTVLRLGAAARSWTEWFETTRIEPMPLWYEDLAADLSGAASLVLALVGEAFDSPVQVERERLADSLSAEWIDRLERDAPELVARRYADQVPPSDP